MCVTEDKQHQILSDLTYEGKFVYLMCLTSNNTSFE